MVIWIVHGNKVTQRLSSKVFRVGQGHSEILKAKHFENCFLKRIINESKNIKIIILAEGGHFLQAWVQNTSICLYI